MLKDIQENFVLLSLPISLAAVKLVMVYQRHNSEPMVPVYDRDREPGTVIYG
jgi:hypothetical protein